MNHDDDDNSKHYHPDMRLSFPFYETDHKTMWKRERNRLAAKKSREKKASHTKFLEDKRRVVESRLEDMKELLISYDEMFDKVLTYFENSVQYDPVVFFNLLCSLRKEEDEQYQMVMMDKRRYAHNQRIERLIVHVNEVIEGMVYHDR